MIEGKQEHYIRRLILVARRLIKAVVWIEKIKRRWQRNKRGYEEIFRHRNPALVAQAFNKFYSYIPPIELFNHRVALQFLASAPNPMRVIRYSTPLVPPKSEPAQSVHSDSDPAFLSAAHSSDLPPPLAAMR